MVSTIIALIAMGVATAAYLGYRHMWDQRDMTEFTDAIKRVEHVLDRMELQSLVVASDLHDSKDRADSVHGLPGEAADAGAQSGSKLHE